MQRMSIFIDGANLFYCQRDILRWWIDWKKFLEFYRKSYTVVSAHFYRAFRIPPPEEERAFGVFLSVNGYHLREKMLKPLFDKYTGEMTYKGNLDIELAIDALTSASRYEVCLLVSGDGDFVPLITALTMQGKVVQVVSTPGSVAIETRSAVGLDFMDLQDIRTQIERKEKPTDRQLSSGRAAPMPPAASGQHQHSSPLDTSKRIGVGQQFDAAIAQVVKGGARLSNPWNADVFLPISGLGVRGYIDDATLLLNPGDTFHVTATEVDTSGNPWSVRVELADAATIAAMQAKYDATRTPPADIPSAGEYELTVGPVKAYGAFLRNPWGAKVLLHASKLGLDQRISDCSLLFQRDERIRVRITSKEVRGTEVLLSVELADSRYHGLLLQRAAKESPGNDA